ncbi:hypothetical protein [Rhodalgimonas zhirmunskyi]|uniref:Uncharacterized protein n=1 Tax=Rhodalgimonas zhirmunskyi TaxID=2964767 RepID=A0AAJ1U4N4_9RHOB|nr:hypothetical protein [Rhodoalgimonas zhirmunskyi]MDQ2093625.1 hypothetical protein [Rhodoalgimonas zhirmunskyi]
MRKIFWTIPLFVAACSGTITGQVRGTGEKVQIEFEEQLDHVLYKARIGNESFAGKAIQDSSSTSIGAWIGTTSTNSVTAVMLGDKGSSLTCQLKYADSTGLTAAGGVGICQHSDGRVVDVLW